MHAPQSAAQLAQSSSSLQTPSPHPGHSPQSLGQVSQRSPRSASHSPSPQSRQKPQSAGQLEQSSVAAHSMSPQMSGQAPQSTSQVEQFSTPIRQTPSPQNSMEQSAGQISPGAQTPSPHTTGTSPSGGGPASRRGGVEPSTSSRSRFERPQPTTRRRESEDRKRSELRITWLRRTHATTPARDVAQHIRIVGLPHHRPLSRDASRHAS